MSLILGKGHITQIMTTILAFVPPNRVIPLSQILPEGVTIATFVEELVSITETTVLSVRELAATDSSLAYSLSTKLYVPLVREVPGQYRKRGVSQYMLERITVQEYMRRAAEPVVKEVSEKIMAGLRLTIDKT